MPTTDIVFYKDNDGSVPALHWLLDKRQVPPKALAKLFVRIERLAQLGHELRRPEAEYLRDGIFELRARYQSVNYRLLYFFHTRRPKPRAGQTSTLGIIALGFTKEDVIPPNLIEQAVTFKNRFESDPGAHTHEEQHHG